MKFSKGAVCFTNTYKEYIRLPRFNENYELFPAQSSVHNLIIGQPYVDMGGKGYVRNVQCPKEQYVDLDFQNRGWKESSYFKATGNVYSSPGQIAFKIDCRWNEYIYLTDMKTGNRELVWSKLPYPENADYMYGFTFLMLQNNFLPDKLA